MIRHNPRGSAHVKLAVTVVHINMGAQKYYNLTIEIGGHFENRPGDSAL